MTVRKAIFPAAGLGTRFLPVTKAQPKEMLPLVDKPTIQYGVEEAIASGIEQVIMVTGGGKRAIVDHFDRSVDLEHYLRERDRGDLLQILAEVDRLSEQVDITYIQQKAPRGLGDAVWTARRLVEGEPCAVLLADDVILCENNPVLKQLIDAHAKTGATVLAVSDTSGGVFNPKGIDPNKVDAYKKETGSVVGFPGSDQVTNAELLELGCDILIPAAIENQIGEHNAPRIKAKVIAEAANGPTSPEADRILFEKGVFLIPDILCNAGGVTVSYFEWVQDLQNLFWREATINARLKEVMVKSFNDVLETAKKHKVDMRTAAYMVAVGRVAEATLTRGIYP